MANMLYFVISISKQNKKKGLNKIKLWLRTLYEKEKDEHLPHTSLSLHNKTS